MMKALRTGYFLFTSLLTHSLNCVGEFNTVEGLKLVKMLNPDVIFLNVTMPYMTGLEMLDHFSTKDHYIIFDIST